MKWLFILMLAATLSGAAPTLNLGEIAAITLEHNLSIKQADNNSQVSANTASLANAGLLPRLDLSSSSTYRDATNQTALGEVDIQSTTITAGLNASYTLFSGFQGLNTYRLLNSQVSATELQEQLTRENILLSTASLYMNLLMMEDNLVIMREQLEISRQRLDQARERQLQGVSGSLTVLAAQVDFDNDSAAVLEAEFSRDEARRNLNLLIGWEIDRAYTPEMLTHATGSYSADSILAVSLERNPSYRISLNIQDQQNLNLKSTVGSILPKVSLSGSYSSQQINSDFDPALDNPDLSLGAGVSLSWNLFDGRKKKSLESGRLLVRNAELNVQDSRRQLESDIQSALAEYEKSRAVLALKENSLSSAELNFEQTAEYFRLGQVGSTDFRTSQLNLSRARLSQAQVRYSVYLYEMAIWQLSGELETKLQAL